MGLGPTKMEYINMEASVIPPSLKPDEVWTVNAGGKVFRTDFIVAMDDLELYAYKHPDYGAFLRQCPVPIMTSRAIPEVPAGVQFPLGQIISELPKGMFYFNTSMAYLVVYAWFIGVKTIMLFGCDFTHPSMGDMREAGRACMEFWLGWCLANGMDVKVCEGSTLLDAHVSPVFYGYLFPPQINMVNKDPEK